MTNTTCIKAGFSVELIPEFKLTVKDKQQLAQLLQACFTDEEFHGRHYFKQFPHYRLILKKEGNIVGQIALDFRVMTLNALPIHVLGLIDVAITPSLQQQGLGKFLMQALINETSEFKENIDFMLLVTDKPKFYEKWGFHYTTQWVKWLVTEEHVNYGMKEAQMENVMMYKPLGEKMWTDNTVLDMMGYWY